MADRLPNGSSFYHSGRTDRGAERRPNVTGIHYQHLHPSYRQVPPSQQPFSVASPTFIPYSPYTPVTFNGTSLNQLQAGAAANPFLQTRARRRLSMAATLEPVSSVSGCSDVSNASSTLPFAVDFRDLEYVEPFDHNLVCPICRCPLVQPMKLICDHIFCAECLNSSFEHQSVPPGPTHARRTRTPPTAPPPRSCPACRNPMGPFSCEPANKLIDRILDDLIVRCPLKSKGCQETLTRSLVQDHVNRYCKFHEIDCPGPKCDIKIQRGRLEEDRCYHSTVTCQCSPRLMMEVELKEHECVYTITECPNCSVKLHRWNAEEHKAVCLEAVIACDAADYGCTFIGKRELAKAHDNSCQLRMLSPYLELYQKRLQEYETTLDHLNRQNDQLRESTLVVGEILDPTQHNQTYRPRENAPNRAQTNRLASELGIDRLVSLTERLQGEVERVTRFNQSLHGEITRVRTTLQEEFARLQENTARSLADIEGRCDMMLINMNVRHEHEIAQTNASIVNLRGQMQWLVSRMQSDQRSSIMQGQNLGEVGPSMSRRAEQLSISHNGGSYGASLPVRTLSDSSRQDPKL